MGNNSKCIRYNFSKKSYCFCELANQRASLDGCRMTLLLSSAMLVSVGELPEMMSCRILEFQPLAGQQDHELPLPARCWIF